MNACASCAMLGRRRLAGADRPDGLVGDDEARASPAANAIASTWSRSTSSVSPASRCSSVSPTHAITSQPGGERGAGAARDHLVGLAEDWRRSEWPTSVPVTPSSRSIARRDLTGERALVGPVRRSARRPRCPLVDRGRRARRPAGRRRRRRRRAASNASQKARVSARPLEHLPVARDQHRHSPPGSPRRRGAPCPRAARATRRRRSRPTRRGRRGRLVERADRVAAADDRVAAAVGHGLGDGARSRRRTRGHSKTPIGPFQKTVLAPRDRARRTRSRVSGPMSSPSQPSGSSS